LLSAEHQLRLFYVESWTIYYVPSWLSVSRRKLGSVVGLVDYTIEEVDGMDLLYILLMYVAYW